MKKILILIILSGCGRMPGQIVPMSHPIRKVDPELLPYFVSFEEDSLTYGKIVAPYQFVSLQFVAELKKSDNGKVVGTCNPGSLEVSIARNSFYAFGECQRKALVYHELGHCLLNLGHNDEKFENGSPKSIMNPYILSKQDCENYKEYYFREIFEEEPKN